MDFFKLAKGASAIVRFLHTSVDTMPIVKVHTVTNKTANGTMGIVVKCNNKDGHTCPLCEKYPKQEYQRVIALYDYTDGQVKCFKTSSRTLVGNIEDTCADWGKKPNEIVFKIGRENNEFGSYYVSIVPDTNYPMPTNLEIGLDEDVTYRFGLYRSDSEMEEYLKTGTMPKHQKSEGGNREDSWAKQYNNAPKAPATPATPTTPPKAPTTPNTATTAPIAAVTTPIVENTTPIVVPKEPSSTFTFENDDFVLPF